MATLSQYLQGKKAQFLKDEGLGWTIVMGNEAGDLDTIASALGYAWYQEQYGTQDDPRKTIALVPTPRADFSLRPENIHALALADILDPFEELLCPEDLPVSHKFTDYALVDHNILDARYSSPNARVVAIIDHHVDEGKYRDTTYPRIIEKCGSCASLVTSLYISRSTPDNRTQILPQLAALLLSAITIDTKGLRTGGDAVDIDRTAAAWLLPYAKKAPAIASTPEGKTPDNPGTSEISGDPLIHSLEDTLNSKKTAVSNLSTRDLLRRDYKQYTFQPSSSSSQGTTGTIEAGLSTVPLSMSTFFKSDLASVAAGTVEWMEERGLSILGVLMNYRNKNDKKRRKQLWVVDERNQSSGDSGLSHALFHGVETEQTFLLKRVDISWYADGSKDDDDNEDDHKDGVSSSPVETSLFKRGFVSRAYKQNNKDATRKQIAPILKQIVEGEPLRSHV